MKLGIRFHDNDYGCVYRKILEILAENHIKGYYLSKNKKKIVDIVNGMAFGVFLSLSGEKEYSKADIENEKYYLAICERHVFIDDEVGEYLKECNGWDSREFHVLDTDLIGYMNNESVKSY